MRRHTPRPLLLWKNKFRVSMKTREPHNPQSTIDNAVRYRVSTYYLLGRSERYTDIASAAFRESSIIF
jgi:hypothetical protein